MDDEAPMFCKVNGAYCVRAFCEDYGCADEVGVPIDANDIAAGSTDPREAVIPLPNSKRKPRRKSKRQMQLI